MQAVAPPWLNRFGETEMMLGTSMPRVVSARQVLIPRTHGGWLEAGCLWHILAPCGGPATLKAGGERGSSEVILHGDVAVIAPGQRFSATRHTRELTLLIWVIVQPLGHHFPLLPRAIRRKAVYPAQELPDYAAYSRLTRWGSMRGVAISSCSLPIGTSLPYEAARPTLIVPTCGGVASVSRIKRGDSQRADRPGTCLTFQRGAQVRLINSSSSSIPNIAEALVIEL